jgi:hypothetical protein
VARLESPAAASHPLPLRSGTWHGERPSSISPWNRQMLDRKAVLSADAFDLVAAFKQLAACYVGAITVSRPRGWRWSRPWRGNSPGGSWHLECASAREPIGICRHRVIFVGGPESKAVGRIDCRHAVVAPARVGFRVSLGTTTGEKYGFSLAEVI